MLLYCVSFSLLPRAPPSYNCSNANRIMLIIFFVDEVVPQCNGTGAETSPFGQTVTSSTEENLCEDLNRAKLSDDSNTPEIESEDVGEELKLDQTIQSFEHIRNRFLHTRDFATQLDRSDRHRLAQKVGEPLFSLSL